mmetsp:Transcript_71165/g.161067  ORF Transcript_71165/g.161067 Transcript_71165/m.161067 type:complete len:355 (+) Transcript_71165:212-1276(+)
MAALVSCRVQAPEVMTPASELHSSLAVFFEEQKIKPLETFRRHCKGALMTFEEFVELLEMVGCQLEKRLALRAFMAADSDGDGSISKHEFVRMLATSGPSRGPAPVDSQWRKCAILPGYCTTVSIASGMNPVHAFCGCAGPGLAPGSIRSYGLPSVAAGSAHGRVASWLKQPGDLVAPHEPLALVAPADEKGHFDAHVALGSLNRTHKDSGGRENPAREYVVPDGLTPSQLNFMIAHGNKPPKPAKEVLNGPEACVFVRALQPDGKMAAELAVGTPIALLAYLPPSSESDLKVHNRTPHTRLMENVTHMAPNSCTSHLLPSGVCRARSRRCLGTRGRGPSARRGASSTAGRGNW